MNDTSLYQQILGDTTPWRVDSVQLDTHALTVNAFLKVIPKAVWACPQCRCRMHIKERPITIHGELWELTPEWMDKNYLFKYKDTYCLSWGEQYAISTNVYGPYECVGKVGESKPHQLNNRAAHGSFFHWKGQFYHTWCIYMPTRKDQRFRETIITYCHMADDGKIVTDTGFLDKHFANGVGQYQADWDKIEAEWFYEKSETVQKSGESASREFVIKAPLDGSWIRFQKTTFSLPPKTFTASFNGGSGAGGVLEIRLGVERSAPFS